MNYRAVVQKGKRYGTAIGFPTANIPYDGVESGIFAATVLLDEKKYHAAVYADTRRRLLEANLDGYSGGDLYGKEIEIELLKKIRDDQKFEDEEKLKAQIQDDITRVLEYFRSF
jgi:riboflavin kinase/FMN adenylyltransferase